MFESTIKTKLIGLLNKLKFHLLILYRLQMKFTNPIHISLSEIIHSVVIILNKAKEFKDTFGFESLEFCESILHKSVIRKPDILT